MLSPGETMGVPGCRACRGKNGDADQVAHLGMGFVVVRKRRYKHYRPRAGRVWGWISSYAQQEAITCIH